MPFAGDDAGGIEGPSLDPEEAAKLQWEVLLDSAEHLADTAAAIADALPDPSDVEERIGEGPPGRVICDIAREEDVDLIVVGAHDRGPLGRLFHSSVSRWVAEHADRSVLVARARP
jgi:nucleotide-binding universal stress UspA family protein